MHVVAAMKNILVPNAPAFLDPLIEIDSCYYYAVPRFYSFHHPNTRWLIAMVKAREEDRVKRKMEMNPEMFKGKYFQMMDYPRLYLPDNPSVTPMFKRQTVLYLTALGISIYLRSLPLIDLILFYQDPFEEVMGNPNEPQFASHLQDLKYGDFHSFPPCVIMLRMYCFEGAVSLLQAGWNPTQPLALPMRRKFERRAFYFFDWLELALGLLSERPLYPLQSLFLNMTRNMTLYKYLMLPLTHMLPPTPQERVQTGLIDVDELPFGAQMIGVRSLLEMAEDYDRYLQMRSCAVEVATLKREAVSVGLNPEILMIQAQDFDGFGADKESNSKNISNNNRWRGGGIGTGRMAARHWAVEHDTRQAVNANNSATDAAAAAAAAVSGKLNQNTSAGPKKQKTTLSMFYASEACRVMHFALEKDKACKRMQVCLDSIIVMTKRGFFVNPDRIAADLPRARDLRNVVILVLNMIQREQEKLDVIFVKIQSGYKKFQHLEEHKLLENRRLTAVANICKMMAALTRILLHSKELVAFVSSSFPPFPASSCDIKLNPKLMMKYDDIKGNVIQEFNSINDGWTYLTKEMLVEVAGIKSMQLHFRVGCRPSEAAMLEAKKAARKAAIGAKSSKNKSNMSNTNCFVTFRKVQRMARRDRGCGGCTTDSATFGSVGALHPHVLPANSSIIESFDEPSDANPVFDHEDDRMPFSQSTLTDGTSEAMREADQQQQQQMLLQQLQGWRASGDQLGDGLLLGDIEEEGDSLSETDLLMSSLCREVQDLLRPRCGDGVDDAAQPRSAQLIFQANDKDDGATIEPEPGGRDRFLSTIIGGGASVTNSGEPSPGDVASQQSQSRYYQPGHRHSQPFYQASTN